MKQLSSYKFWLKVGLLVLAGGISGATFLPEDTVAFNGLPDWHIQFGPGIWFGLATLGLLFKRFRFGLGGPFIWAAASVGAWYVAFMVYLQASEASGAIGYTLAGLVGAFILGLAAWLTVRGMSLGRFVVVTLIGAVFGLVMEGIMSLEGGGNGRVLLALAFAVWQLAVGLVVAHEAESK